MYQQAIFIFALLFGVSNAFPGRIVLGEDTDITEIPYQVSLQRAHNNFHFCGGAIISDRWILTAGHCIETDPNPVDKQVMVGMTSKKEGGIVHTVKQTIRDPRFGSPFKFSYDIALMELNEPIEFNERAQPVRLPKDDEPLPVGHHCRVGGWGRLWHGGPTPDHLQSTTMPIWKPERCARAYHFPKDYFVGHGAPMICANNPNSLPNTCNGDSGGPLVCNGVQYGIVSYGRGCTEPGYPKVFSNVYNLREFVRDNTGIEI